MPSTPKNPLDQSDQAGATPRFVAPRVPPCDGGQFARDFATPSEIQCTRDRYYDEIPTDRPYHVNTTPGEDASLYTGRHYSDDWSGGYENYGVSVQDRGQTPSRETVTVNPNSADRGKES